MLSAPTNIDASTVSALAALLAAPGRCFVQTDAILHEFGDAQALRQCCWGDQPAVGHEVVLVEGH
ncbi:MAG: hypothetical protein ACRD0K_17330 [Egibacteraceae bacterium]